MRKMLLLLPPVHVCLRIASASSVSQNLNSLRVLVKLAIRTNELRLVC
jgi:hypothetical protein